MEQNAAKDNERNPDGTPKIIYLANEAGQDARRCPNCGKDLPGDAAKCPNCQTPIVPVPEPASAASDDLGNFDSLGYIKSALAAKYEVIELVSQTASSSIFRAVHTQLGKEVALKVLLRNVSLDRSYTEAFHRRFRSIDKLSQSNIIRIYDEGVESGIHYSAMEFLKGIDLGKRITSHGPLPVEVMIGFMLPAISALGHAHRNAIVHGNLKSSSIFLHTDGRIILTGFGTQQSMKGTRVAFKRSPRSYEYLSPEEAADTGADARSDIYSLGVIMYHALSGKFPYSGDTPDATLKAIVSGQHEPVIKFRQVPSWLDSVINRCLQKDASRRVQSCGELILLLNAGSTARPTSASVPEKTPPSPAPDSQPEKNLPDEHPKAAKGKPAQVSKQATTHEASAPPRAQKVELSEEIATPDPSHAERAPAGNDTQKKKEVPPATGASDEISTRAKSGKSPVGWIAAVVIVLAIGAGVYFFMNRSSSPSNPAAGPPPVQQSTADQEQSTSSVESNSKSSEPNQAAEASREEQTPSPEASSPAEKKPPIEAKASRTGAPKVVRKREPSRERASAERKTAPKPAIVLVAVPDLTGNQLNVAERILKLNGLKVGHVTTIPDPANDGLVVREVPKPGTQLQKGATVNLIVGSK